MQFVIARAIGYGWLTAGEEWQISLVGAGTVAIAGVHDLLRLLVGFDTLYGACSVPTVCTVRSDDGISVTWRLDGDGEWRKVTDTEANGESICIAVEHKTSPYHRVADDRRPDFIIRRAFLPVDFAAEQRSDFGRQPIAPERMKTHDRYSRPFCATSFASAISARCRDRLSSTHSDRMTVSCCFPRERARALSISLRAC